MNHEDEICCGCVLSSLCKAGQATESQKSAECSNGLRRKAIWLMFWIPLIIIGGGLFVLSGLAGCNEAVAFGIIVLIVAIYYIVLKLKLNNKY